MSRPKNSSKYVKYDEQIRSSLLQGKTYKTIVDELNNLAGTYDEFTDVGLRYYCTTKGLISYRSKVYHSSMYNVNLCDDCKYCRVVISATGNTNVRLCEKANKLINNGVKATTWCPLQKSDE